MPGMAGVRIRFVAEGPARCGFLVKAGLANDKISDNLEDWAACWHFPCLSSHFCTTSIRDLESLSSQASFYPFFLLFHIRSDLFLTRITFLYLRVVFPLLISIKNEAGTKGLAS